MVYSVYVCMYVCTHTCAWVDWLAGAAPRWCCRRSRWLFFFSSAWPKRRPLGKRPVCCRTPIYPSSRQLHRHLTSARHVLSPAGRAFRRFSLRVTTPIALYAAHGPAQVTRPSRCRCRCCRRRLIAPPSPFAPSSTIDRPPDSATTHPQAPPLPPLSLPVLCAARGNHHPSPRTLRPPRRRVCQLHTRSPTRHCLHQTTSQLLSLPVLPPTRAAERAQPPVLPCPALPCSALRWSSTKRPPDPLDHCCTLLCSRTVAFAAFEPLSSAVSSILPIHHPDPAAPLQSPFIPTLVHTRTLAHHH